jgi:hypothetical protein
MIDRVCHLDTSEEELGAVARPTSPAVFVEGFTAALWVGAAFSAAGVMAAAAVSRRSPSREDLAADERPPLLAAALR